MGDLRPELSINGEAAVEGIARASREAKGEFALEHQNGGSWRVRHGQELEDERTRNLRGELVTSFCFAKTQQAYLIGGI